MTDKWDRVFLSHALLWAKSSKDPNTQVGCVIADDKHVVRSQGFNGFPRGIADTAERLNDRDMKLRLTVHAERNAICSAAMVGVPLRGTTLYLAATDDSGTIWGGSPCTMCSLEIIQSGVVEIVSYTAKAFSKWRDDLEFAEALLQEAGIRIRYVDP